MLEWLPVRRAFGCRPSLSVASIGGPQTVLDLAGERLATTARPTGFPLPGGPGVCSTAVGCSWSVDDALAFDPPMTLEVERVGE
jgi:hypothetical protein